MGTMMKSKIPWNDQPENASQQQVARIASIACVAW
jgi:hypothetical protein